jgi:hypothetical protein
MQPHLYQYTRHSGDPTINFFIKEHYGQPSSCNAVNGLRGAIAGGLQNTIAAAVNGGFIGGGACNTLSGTYGIISGGYCNTVSGTYSAVLGGKCNTVTHDCASVFGNGLVSCSNDTFHVSCLNAVNTPNGPSGHPSGTMYYQTSVPGIPGFFSCCFLFLK